MYIYICVCVEVKIIMCKEDTLSLDLCSVKHTKMNLLLTNKFDQRNIEEAVSLT
jgi:hypothetical protein